MKALKKRYLIPLFVAILLFAVHQFYFLGSYFNRARYGDLHETAEIMAVIDNKYVDKVDVKKCQEKILQSGLQACLDKHSYYYSADDIISAKPAVRIPFGGIGLQVDKKDDYIHVVSVFENSPAQKAGIIPNDFIIAVDGVSTKNMSPEDAVNKIRGSPGEKVTLTIKRGQDKARDVILIREKIEQLSVRASLVSPEIGYIRITYFDQASPTLLYLSFYDLGMIVDFLEIPSVTKRNVRGLVIDLRGNPGGGLNEVLNMLEFFSPEKGRVTLAAKGEHIYEKFPTLDKGFFNDLPVVVLIDVNSASAAEIMAGVLKIWGHSVVGEVSHGKGTIQEFPIWLSSGSALRLTTARYFLGEKEIAVNGIGISPNHEVKWKKSEGQSEEDFMAEYISNFGNQASDPQLKKAVEVLKEKIANKGGGK